MAHIHAPTPIPINVPACISILFTPSPERLSTEACLHSSVYLPCLHTSVYPPCRRWCLKQGMVPVSLPWFPSHLPWFPSRFSLRPQGCTSVHPPCRRWCFEQGMEAMVVPATFPASHEGDGQRTETGAGDAVVGDLCPAAQGASPLRGLMASRDIQPGDAVISVPLAMLAGCAPEC